MSIIYGDEKDLTINGVESFDTEIDFVPVIVYPPIVFDDQLIVGTLKTIAFGDLRDLTMEAKAVSNHTTPGVYTTAVDSRTIEFGDDTLSFGDKNNVLHGDMQDLTLHAVGGITSDGVLTQAWISRNTFNYGDDIISAGNGTNTVYGDARDISWLVDKGNNQDGDVVTDAAFGASVLGPLNSILNNNVFFGLDTITVGNGNNTVFGDVQDISWIVLGGKALSVPTGGETINDLSGNSLSFSGDLITVGNGTNVIYGDFKDWLMQAQGGTTFGAPTGIAVSYTVGEIVANTITMNVDTIKLGDGNNTVFGDGQSLTLKVFSGIGVGGDGPFGFIGSNSLTFGDDIIQPDTGKTAAGHNVVFGDLNELRFDVQGQLGIGADNEPSGQIRTTSLTFGSDMISLGNGGNLIYGDTNDVTYHVDAGNNSNPDIIPGFVSIRGNSVTYGGDTITSGSGVDTIYADTHNLSLTAIGEQATNASSIALIGGFRGVGNSFDFGQDIVHAGGGADLVVGDAWDVSLVAKGGLATSPDLLSIGRVDGVQINPTSGAGNDMLFGEGGNDTLYGDFHSLTLQALGGSVTGTGGTARGEVTNNIINFGSDTIDGGAGNDFLSGDLVNLTLSAVNGTDTSGVGDVSGVLSGNVLNWGDDTLTGGSGADTFAFTLVDLNGDLNLEMQGNDIITDFEVGVDKLQFSGVADLSALNNATTAFTLSDADGDFAVDDTVITYDGGGSITLYDVTLAAYPVNTVFA